MIDYSQDPTGIGTFDTDVCVVGSGPAGIAIARELAGLDVRVCLVEGGGLRPDESSGLSRAENVGLPYGRLEGARLRGFGGNSPLWALTVGDGLGARLRPLDPIDFERREEVPYSGWPFDKTHLDPYYARAHEVFEIGPYDYDPNHWRIGNVPPQFGLDPGLVRDAVFQFGRGEVFYEGHRRKLFDAQNITTLLHANVTEIELDPNGRVVRRLRVAHVPGGHFVLNAPSEEIWTTPFSTQGGALWIKAGLFVLAAGGTENPRLLLLSDSVHRNGIGNEHDVVGRYFMEHVHLWPGRLIPARRDLCERLEFYGVNQQDGTYTIAKLALTERVMRDEGLMNWCVSLHPNSTPEGVRSARRLLGAARKRQRPAALVRDLRYIAIDTGPIVREVWRRVAPARMTRSRSRRPVVAALNSMSEQSPDPSSRITLSDQLDVFGQRRVRLDWRLNDTDLRTMRRAEEILDEEFRRAGLGHLQLDEYGQTHDVTYHGGWHHMGTTRMHVDPKRGVVDSNSKVHGVENLYLAGSSVFPTGGCANPALTVVALAIRLADHLRGRVQQEAKHEVVSDGRRRESMQR